MENNANSEMPAFGFYSGDALKDMPGLTKREYFAAMAMQGLLAGRWASEERVSCSPETISTLAIQHADSLLIELSTPQP